MLSTIGAADIRHTDRMIRLAELLARRELGLLTIAGCENADGVELLGAEVCELPDPRPWLDSGWMLLTTGVALGHGAHVQRLLVERAADARAAAIGFSVGLVHADVPDTVRETCELLSLPLVAIPAVTPFGLVLAAIAQRSGPHELQTAQRTLAMQTYLMEALAAPEPEAELLRRLGSLLSGTALLADETGAVEGAPNAALPHALWGPLRGGRGVRLHHLRGVRYVTAPIGDRVGARRWLVVAGAPDALPDQLARRALASAERLVRLIHRARPPRPAEARAVRAELAQALLGWRPAGDRQQLGHRAAALGLGVDEPLNVAVLRLRPAPRQPREERSQQLGRAHGEIEEQLTLAAVPFLIAHHQHDVVLVVPAPATPALEASLADLAAAQVLLDVGIGRAAATLDGLPRSYLDARFAVEQLAASEASTPAPRVLSHDAFDLATSVVCEAEPALLDRRRDALADARLGAPLRETLAAYLAHQLDVPRTAAALNLHPNSVRYRLSRIERELGRSLAEPATIANLYLATLVDRAASSREAE